MTETLISLQAISKRFDDHTVLENINLDIQNGEFLTLLGPSGCGKTTLLRLLSGFEQPCKGRIIINGRDITSTPPQQRDVHTVFQSYALFPHLNVYDNIAFGLACHGVTGTEQKDRIRDILRRVKLDKFAHRKPDELSGGQQQRVAIARALVNRPLVLLLDEPLSSLDYKLRKAMQIELKQLQRELKMTFIFVTHDQEEALSISDRVAVLDHGQILQLGTPREVYEEPTNLTVAKFVGELNVFDKIITEKTASHYAVDINGFPIHIKNTQPFNINDKIHILIRPEDLRVWDEDEIEDKTNAFPGKIEEVIYKGSTVDLIVRLPCGQRLSATEFFDEDDEDLAYTLGESVWVQWPPGWEVVLPYEN